jgi:hypothetical protein
LQLESSAEGIHDRLKRIDDLQTHHRLREATGRKRAEDLNERVMWWSIGQTALVLICGIGQVEQRSLKFFRSLTFCVAVISIEKFITPIFFQVFVLRSFFTEKRPSAF